MKTKDKIQKLAEIKKEKFQKRDKLDQLEAEYEVLLSMFNQASKELKETEKEKKQTDIVYLEKYLKKHQEYIMYFKQKSSVSHELIKLNLEINELQNEYIDTILVPCED